MSKGDGGLYRPTYRDRHGKTQRSTIWRIRFSVRGQRFNFSSGTANRTEAGRIKREKMAEAGRGHVGFLDAEKLTFEDLGRFVQDDHALNASHSEKHVAYSLKMLKPYLGEKRALDITTDTLTKCALALQREGYAPATISVAFSFLKRGFNLAIRAGRLSTKPYFPAIRIDNARTGFFERSELDAILEHLPDLLRPFAVVCYVTGWRPEKEVLTRQWSHVDFNAGWLRLEPGEGKTRKARMFPLDVIPDLRTALETCRARTDEAERRLGRIIPWVFHRANGKPIRSYETAWRTARKKAGLPNRQARDFRRTAVRNLDRAGATHSEAMAMVGHETEAMYRRYRIVNEADVKDAGAKLARLLESERGQVRRIAPVGRKMRLGRFNA